MKRICSGDYVNTWLKIKEEASGFLSRCTTLEERRRHVQEYLDHEEVELDMDSIAVNKGRRTVARLMLNSMWGKFGQRLDKTHMEEFIAPRALRAFLVSGRYSVTYVSPMTEERVVVHYKNHDPMIDVSPNLNIFVACFTTCYARLKLYEELERLNQRVVYFDTDSIIFRQEEEQYQPPLESTSGSLRTNERVITLWNSARAVPRTTGTRLQE